MIVAEHAKVIAATFANSVADLESHCAQAFGRTAPPTSIISRAIETTWLSSLNYITGKRVRPDRSFVSAMYAQLVTAADINDGRGFKDNPELPWYQFYVEGCGDEDRCEDAWVIAELYWGQYVEYLHLSLGWLVMNAVRVNRQLHALLPSPETTDRFVEDLLASGPDLYDAENFRALLYCYEQVIAG